MEVTNRQIEQLIEQGYEVDGQRYINEAFEIFKKKPGFFIAYFVILAAAGVFLSRVNTIGGNAYGLLSAVLAAGYFIVATKLEKGQSPDFGDFFKGFNLFIPLFVAGILTTLFIAIGLVLLIIPGIYLAISYFFVIPLIIYKGYNFWPAMETSRKLITKEFFAIFIFALLLLLLNIVGALLCGVGLLVSLPISQIAIYCAYKDIVAQGQTPDLVEDIKA